MERQLSSLISGLRLTTCIPLMWLGWLWLASEDAVMVGSLLLVVTTLGFLLCARGPVGGASRAWLLGATGLLLASQVTSGIALLAAFGLYTGALCSICDDVLEGRYRDDVVSAVRGAAVAVVTALVSILLIGLSWIFCLLGWAAALCKLLGAVFGYFRACWSILTALQDLRRERESEFLGVTRVR